MSICLMKKSKSEFRIEMWVVFRLRLMDFCGFKLGMSRGLTAMHSTVIKVDRMRMKGR